MKKIVAIAAMISAISLSGATGLLSASVWLTIDNESGDDARVTGQYGGDVSVDDNKSERCGFKLNEDGTTTLKVRPVNDTMSAGTTVEITAQDNNKTFTLKPDLELELDGQSIGHSKKRRQGESRGRSRRKNRRRQASQDEDQD